MAYQKTNWVNDITDLDATNMNHIEDGVEKAYGVELLAVVDTAPSECSVGDKYFNTTTNKIYEATATDTWNTEGYDAESGVFYIVYETSTMNIYTYNGTTLIQHSTSSINVHNTQTTSNTDTYSCNYSNEHYEGIELWTNSNVTSDFDPTTINLNGTYSKLIIEFVADSSTEGKKVKSFKEILTSSTSINFKLESLYVGYFRLRDCSASNNQVYFGSGYYYTEVGGSAMSSNIQCIPTRIIGYK